MVYDVIVVGAGHAGCEAALASARLGVETLLLTISLDTIAAMSCNPAIGGPAAKSHLVRELDALGGVMGQIIDKTYLNIRSLNETRGPAVYALRAQADKKMYQAEMTLLIERQPHLTLKQGIVSELLVDNQKVTGVKLKSGRIYFSKTVIITTGTFLGGQIVMGDVKYPGGRQGEPAADELSQSLQRCGLKMRRFQTATPPRINRRSVNFDELTPQPLQTPEWGFSWDGLPGDRPQHPCWITTTNKDTIQFITANLDMSPIRNGSVTGKGPHFCPSIDRKVINFPDKYEHLIFLEPEGIYTEEMYLLGLTTAMPEDIQEKILATIPGLKNAEIVRPGYAVEYDCLDSFQFYPSLESKHILNLYTAGQINGTSGYEEAAVQGVIAGINAARKVKNLAPLIMKRTDSYIGVLIDDLVTKGTEEPYRMMTSLAEYRIFFRLDNALVRLGQVGYEYGLVSNSSWQQRFALLNQITELRSFYEITKVKSNSKLWALLKLSNPERGYRLKDIVLRPEVTESILMDVFPELARFPQPVRQNVWNELKLEGYLKRQLNQLQEDRQLEEALIPANFDFLKINGLSVESKDTLMKIKPISLGQTLRVPSLNDSEKAAIILHYQKYQGANHLYGLSS